MLFYENDIEGVTTKKGCFSYISWKKYFLLLNNVLIVFMYKNLIRWNIKA